MRVYILLFNARTENEGIHTIQIGDRNTILMFKEEDDALRYAGLLEAQDFPAPSVEAIDSEEVEAFCRQSDYGWEIVDSEKLAVPPEKNVEQPDWNDEEPPTANETSSNSSLAEAELERIRQQLEGLL
ncbi:DUF3110 domain-containing protein [Myxosarcina sp. GI1]|uniref:DUF3110 domain-containing protein n=1 Tax=Myxosarcina sp. GI1 TaxID=1541065 RepID=UPI00056D635A|nr:DUF3110 domain-containing protein [Myxosarcina sp. GI1]